jgi:Protein of unknown function (DUF2891)
VPKTGFVYAAVALGLWPALAVADAGKDLTGYLESLPAAQMPAFDEWQAMALVAMPLSCIDRPQAQSDQRAEYLWTHDSKARLLDGYDKNRAFYGCFDWHSAVNSTWTLVAALKQFPQMPVGQLIREKLRDHLGKRNIEGEMAFFRTARNFEAPYGYAWLLKLYAELSTWNDPDAKIWAQNLAPMVEQFSRKMTEYLRDLPYPVRGGAHPNTAFSISLMLDYTNTVNDPALKDVLLKTATRFFLKDRNCPTAYEPSGTDFLSPCLAEARLMSMTLDRPRFVAWLNDFLPAVNSEAFKPLTGPTDVSAITKHDLQGAKSHLIGLAFARAEALLDIASVLPPNDGRIPVYERLAAIHAKSGFQALADAGYFGSHWLGTYAVLCSRAHLRSVGQKALVARAGSRITE